MGPMLSDPLLKRLRKYRLFIGLACLAFILLWNRRVTTRNRLHNADPLSQIDQWRNDPLIKQAQDQLWQDLHSSLVKAKPPNKPPVHGPAPTKEDPNSGPTTYSIVMTDEEITQMTRAHEQFVGDSTRFSLDGVYKRGSRGIVTTAGGKYLRIFLVSLRLLRKTGSTLPVEVFLADDSEYDPYVCEKLFPSLNARCRVLSHSVRPSKNFELKSYQYKVFSILFSSFEDVLFLDADNLPIKDPSPLMDFEPYPGYGLVLWPDFWKSSASPLFYKIQGGDTRVAPEPGQRTSETGQIIVSKKKHSRTLLLSTYYNFYGPDNYYSLLSQGSPGEGDKETFAAAADFLGAPYYLVERGVDPLGFFDEDDNHNFKGEAMLQFDPSDDFRRIPMSSRQPAFIHANFPKFDPYAILTKGITTYKDGRGHRIWQDVHQKGYKFGWGSDPEQEVWREMIYVACSIGTHLRVDVSEQGACKELKKHYKSVWGAIGPIN